MTQQEFINLFQRAERIAAYIANGLYGQSSRLISITTQGSFVVANVDTSRCNIYEDYGGFAYDSDLVVNENWNEAADAFIAEILERERAAQERQTKEREERQREKDLAEYRKLQDKLFPNT